MVNEALQIRDHLFFDTYDVIVVGTGPVGVHAVKELHKIEKNLTVAIFGDEPWQPYNRVKLSSFVSGEIDESSLYSDKNFDNNENLTTYYNNRITRIHRENKFIEDSQGNRYGYSQLILATGSRAHIPNIKGVKLANVYTFRDLSDAQKLMGRSVRTRSTVIIGGGLLGLETARAMQRFNTQVHVIEHSQWLMFNQLDEQGGNLLNTHVNKLGIQVHTDSRVKAILGKTSVEGVELANGDVIDCDTVVMATGIVPNKELAITAGLTIRKGVRVNNQMQTYDQSIYAIGECAEHGNKVYGLVAPGLEQAAVAAHSLCGKSAGYHGSISATNLKVLDIQVFSVGDFQLNTFERDIVIYKDDAKGIYRKLIITNGRLRAAMGIGDWQGVQRIQEAVAKKRRIWLWQIKRFKEDGIIWNDAKSENVIEWPATATVCNCTGVTRGQLDTAIKEGAVTVNDLSECTGASTVCGSCKYLLTDFIGGSAKPEPTRGYTTLQISAFITLLSVIAIYFLPAMPYANTVQVDFQFDQLWRDNFFKQISGFTLLGLSIFISIISFRKRIKKLIKLWDYAAWRVLHVVFGVITVAVLFTHTGFRLGDNLNFYLMFVFSSLLLVGGIASWITGYEYSLPTRLAKQVRLYAVWSHILLLWPLPALLSMHVIKTYYF